MNRFFKLSLADFRSNRFLNLITIFTIALSILVVSVFLLFFENVGRMIESWNQGGRAMIYLKDGVSGDRLPQLQARIMEAGNIREMVFVSKEQALDRLKKEMAGNSAFLDTLQGNPLPDAIEIRMVNYHRLADVENLARTIRRIDGVEDMEYGQGWLGKFLNVFNLFKITGYAMCSLFFLIALFITANTVRLAFYSRRTEVEVMRLVGATESFIKAPFYLEGLIQGFLGGILGVLILAFAYGMIASGISQSFSSYVYFDIRFLSVKTILLIVFGSTFLGWFGCYLSLKQILR